MALTVGLMASTFAGVVGLSLDLADWYSARRAMQTAVDAAALGGALQLFEGASSSQATTAATTDGNLNTIGLARGATLSISVNTGADTVTATMSKTADLLLSAVFLGSAPTISVSATAGIVSSNSGAQTCLEITSPNAANALLLTGSAAIQASGCKIVVDSSSTSAVSIQGNSMINSASICGPGNFSATGSSKYTPAPTTCSAMPNSLAGLSPTNANGSCDFTNFQTYGNNYYTYVNSCGTTITNTSYATANVDKCVSPSDAPPPTFSCGNSSCSINLYAGVYCGGLNLAYSSGTSIVNFAPNPNATGDANVTFIVRNGGFDSANNSTITGSGVSFFLTGSGNTLNFGGSSSVNLSAPSSTADTMYGISVYQDNSQTTGSETNYIQGYSTINFTGLLYFGSQNVQVNGNSSNPSSAWTSMVAYTLQYPSGYSTLYLNSNYGNTTIPTRPELEPSVVALLQ